jgi:hypothetical protein
LVLESNVGVVVETEDVWLVDKRQGFDVVQI